MNSILQLKGQFEQHSGTPGGGKRNIPVGGFVESTHILDLINDLYSLQTYWNEHTLIKGALISVYYTSVVAKTNRIRGLLCKGSSDPNDSTVAKPCPNLLAASSLLTSESGIVSPV